MIYDPYMHWVLLAMGSLLLWAFAHWPEPIRYRRRKGDRHE